MRRVAFVIMSMSALAGCPEEVAPDEIEEPVPGWQLSTPFPEIRSLNDIIVLSPTSAYAIGTDGAIIHFDGQAWSRQDSGVTVDLEHISGFVDGEGTEHLMIAGREGTVLHRADPERGAFTVVPSGTTALLFSCVLVAPNDAWIVGDAGTILRWNGTAIADQSAQSAQIVQPPTGPPVPFEIPEPLRGVNQAGGLIIAVGAGGAIYTTNGDPACAQECWTKEVSGTIRPLVNVHNRNGTWIPTTDGVLMNRTSDFIDDVTPNWDDGALIAPAPVFLQDVVFETGGLYTVGLSEDVYHFDGGEWLLTRVAEAAELRAIDGTTIPPIEGAEEGEEGFEPQPLVLAVGGGGRIVRGPSFLGLTTETLLETRAADGDFESDE